MTPSIYKMVGSGAVTKANMRISAVNGTAFIDFSDSEAAANKLINHKGYLLKVRDSSKRAIQGYVKAAGTGETLDVELVVNGTFAADTNWNKTDGWSIAGTAVKVSSTGLTLTASAAISLSVGALYKGVLDVTAGVSDYQYTMTATGSPSFKSYSVESGTQTNYRTLITDGDSKPRIFMQAVTGAGTFDNFSVRKVLTPSATGVTITSTKGGSTFNFAALDSAFNYNDVSGYTYELWQVNNAVEVASGSIAAGEMLADTTATNAFVAPVGVDLSAYQTGKYIFAAYNTVGGYGAFGYIKGTAPGGLTKAAAKNITGITKANPGIVTYQAGHGHVGGELIYFSGLTEMTSLNTDYRTLGTKSGDTFQLGDLSGETAAETTGGACSEQVTDCAATGALIVSAKDGATRDWAYKHASFNPDLASTYKLYYVGD